MLERKRWSRSVARAPIGLCLLPFVTSLVIAACAPMRTPHDAGAEPRDARASDARPEGVGLDPPAAPSVSFELLRLGGPAFTPVERFLVRVVGEEIQIARPSGPPPVPPLKPPGQP